MENLALVGLVENLKPALAELIVRRVVQHQPNGFIFQTRSARLQAMKVVVDPLNPAVYVSESRPPIETPTMDFLMILRKHLTSAEVISFTKPLSERVLEFVFKTVVPSRELETMALVVELLPNAPNLILLDAERRVLASFLPLTPQHGMAEYETYAYPSSGDKIDLERILGEPIPELEWFAKADNPQRWLIRHIAGLGPVFAGELVHRWKKSGRPIQEEIANLVAQVRLPSTSSWIYTDLPIGHLLETNDLQRLRKAVVTPVQLEFMERTHSSKTFRSILEAARYYYDEIETRSLLDQAKAPVMRDLKDAANKFAGREKRLLKEQQKYEDASGLQRTAQMLTTSGLKMEQHYESVPVTDYFGDTPQQVQIPVDSKLSLRENIDRMFKRHSKAGRAKQIVAEQLADVRNRQGRLSDQMRRLVGIKDWATWVAIADKLNKERSTSSRSDVHRPPPGKPETEPRRLRHFQIDGCEVFIGRNGRENDEVTFHIAAPDDFWLHVADYSGSHVIVRNPNRDKELDSNVLTKAAQLAAFHSQARNSSKVKVHYTRRKNVVKPKRAKPGMVRVLEFKSISVEPKNWLE